MRFLAPYTVYEGAVCRLHLFDISSDGSVSHRAVEEETAYTLYVQGIAVVAAAGIDTALISERIREMEGQGVPLAEISRAIAGMNLPSGTEVYVATFPFQTLQRIGRGVANRKKTDNLEPKRRKDRFSDKKTSECPYFIVVAQLRLIICRVALAVLHALANRVGNVPQTTGL